jgi:hypothetical protein
MGLFDWFFKKEPPRRIPPSRPEVDADDDLDTGDLADDDLDDDLDDDDLEEGERA